jgi:hypothetical protein
MALFAVAAGIGKHLTGRNPVEFIKTATEVVREMEAAEVEKVLQMRPPTARRRR